MMRTFRLGCAALLAITVLLTQPWSAIPGGAQGLDAAVVGGELLPLDDGVLIRPASTGQQGAPQTAPSGEVVGVGDGRRSSTGERIPVDVSVGDTVVFAGERAVEVNSAGQSLVMVTSADVLAVVGPGGHLVPRDDRVLLRPDDRSLPPQAPRQAHVVGVGPGAQSDDNERIPVDVKTGDTVLFTGDRAVEVMSAGERLLIAPASDVLAVVGQ